MKSMPDIRKLPAVEERVESGPIQFGDDWPGTFIRGDHAASYAVHLREFLKKHDKPADPADVFILATLHGLLEDLESSNLLMRPAAS